MNKKVLMAATQSFSIYAFGLPLARELRQHGYDVTFACSGRSYSDARSYVKEIEAEGWRVEQVPLGRRLCAPSDIIALWKLFRMLRRGGYSVLHTQNSKAGVIGRLAAKFAGTPVLIHMSYDFKFRDERPTLRDRLLRRIERWSAGMCDVLLFICEAERARAIANRIAPEPKLVLVGHGVDLDEFRDGCLPQDGRSVVCRTYRLDPSAPIVGTVGRLIPHKGHECLLRAASLLLRQLPAVQFLIVGGGPERKRLEALAEQLGIARSVTFTGFLPMRENMFPIFSALDVFVLPTKKEGFGVVFVEAMASTLPVVACDIAPVNTIVKQGETGILVPPDDSEGFARALLRLLVNADLRKSMGAAGRLRAFALFDLHQALLRTVEVFDRLCSRYEPIGPVAERLPGLQPRPSI